MKLSVFTPTHDVTHLKEAHDSLKVQPYADWEWVIVTNGDPAPVIPESIYKDPRVKIYLYPSDQPRTIGALKRFACERCQGEVFIELDHDDMLVPGILPLIARGAEKGGFIYSDTACFNNDSLQSYSFDEAYGWETYNLHVYGREFTAMRAFTPNARSLCEIFFTPDHVRCWRRDAYNEAGGHDVTMEVADDHDLICRTYLAGVEFVHTGTCGYLYRSHPGNTVKLKNEKIQKAQAEVKSKYLHQLIDAWLNRNSLPMIDLATADNLEDAIQMLDCYKYGTVGCVKAYDCLHRYRTDRLGHVLNEIYRVLVPGGWFCIMAPSTDGRAAWVPAAQSYWNEYVIQSLCQTGLRKNIPSLDVRFQNVRTLTTFPSDEHKAMRASYVYAELCALKGQRQAGRVFI